jgi:hypothetical protein
MKKITTIGLIVLIIWITISRGINAAVFTKKALTIGQDDKSSIFLNTIIEEIERTKDKVLVVDEIIGDVYVKYWEHIVDDILVKNDSMLLHFYFENDSFLNYERSWTDSKWFYCGYGEVLDLDNYFWKRKVVFPEEDDCGFFYTFLAKQNFPLFCWEVRYTDGTTIIYDPNWTQIGKGVTAPSKKGFVIQGYGESDWRYWRENAQYWYKKWCDNVFSISSPTISQISYFINNKTLNTELFYVIAHSGGLSNRFLARENVYYFTSQLKVDMANRNPMKLAILCCCESMNETGPDTLSYEFRKGETKGTVTIGYIEMSSCPAWIDSLDWQDYMFTKMDQGYTMKIAFDKACQNYPRIANNVKFIGDTELKIDENATNNDEIKSLEMLKLTSSFYKRVFFHFLLNRILQKFNV